MAPESKAALPPSTWNVTAQQETSQVGPDGQVRRGVRVSFTTGLGQQGSVFVPDAEYRVDMVRGYVADQAAKIDAIAQLSSG